MIPKQFFQKFLLMPLIFIPAFTAYYFFFLWRFGLEMGIGKGITRLEFGVPLAVSFLVLLIICIVRLYRKRSVLYLSQVMIMESGLAATGIFSDYHEQSWNLNMYLYQDKREAFIQRILSDSATVEEKLAVIETEKHRNYPQWVALKDDEFHLQNSILADSVTHQPTVSRVMIQRNCDGALTAAFMMDNEFLGSDYAILYSQVPPKRNEYHGMNEYGVPYDSVVYTIEDYTVLRNISPNWYYVRCKSPWAGMFDGLFNFGWGGGSGGTGSAGGCQ